MKNCPFCAEEIQDAALVCKHCGRKQPVAKQSQEQPPARRLLVLFAVLAGVVIAGGALAFRSHREQQDALEHAEMARQDSINAAERARVADSIAAATPQVIALADSAALTIPAGQFYSVKFSAPKNNRNCKVLGKVVGLAGAEKDVAVMLFTDDQYADWRANSSEPHTTWPIEKAQTINLDFQLYGLGTYYLVVSNGFSVFTDKVVQLHAQLRCTSDPRPVIRE